MSSTEPPKTAQEDKLESPEAEAEQADKSQGSIAKPTEVGGPKGPEPTRYGDWELKGRCIDF